jgi:hypothetical protein
MMRHVLMEVREPQQKLEHTVSLGRIGFCGSFLETFDNGERVGEQPLETSRVDGLARAAAFECAIRSNERFVEEMIETKLLSRECARNRVRT